MADMEHTLQELFGKDSIRVPEQYEAGYAARQRDEALSLTATPSWQAGWTDADREMGSYVPEGSVTQASLPFFGTGGEARRRGLPFDPCCSDDWKLNWIETDIVLGLEEMRSVAGSQ